MLTHRVYHGSRYVNSRKYESRYDMVNKVVTEYWVYGEYSEGFGTPRNAFFTTEETDDIRGLRHAGRSENIEWGRSYLKLGKIRLSEQIFVCNSTLGPGIGYTPHQLVLGIGSGIPGNYQAPESESSKFAQSLKRIKSGINQTQAQQAPSTLGGDFPYKPGDLVNFLGPRGRIGQGYITGIFGKEYRVAHSGT